MQCKQLDLDQRFKVAFRNARAEAAVMTIPPGDAEGDPQNKHEDADQWLFVVAGRGTAIVEGKPQPLKPGTLLLIEQGERHEVRNDGDEPLRTLNFYAPPEY
ncbi:MAG TPA: cupin domain-containing protein [Rhodanobacteraceae bacterium]|nr:cupin domain-containing protein [Rhodanobacteraceae bacterium]